LKKGLVVRFEFSQEEEGFTISYETDLFFDAETEEYILFTLRKSEAGEEEKEEVFDETQAVSYYDAMKEYIVDEFYEKGDVEEFDEAVDEAVEVVLPQEMEVKSDEITIEFLQEQINGLLIVKEVTDDLETLQLIDEQINGLNIIIDLKNQEND
jgi:hypothetical protein